MGFVMYHVSIKTVDYAKLSVNIAIIAIFIINIIILIILILIIITIISSFISFKRLTAIRNMFRE